MRCERATVIFILKNPADGQSHQSQFGVSMALQQLRRPLIYPSNRYKVSSTSWGYITLQWKYKTSFLIYRLYFNRHSVFQGTVQQITTYKYVLIAIKAYFQKYSMLRGVSIPQCHVGCYNIWLHLFLTHLPLEHSKYCCNRRRDLHAVHSWPTEHWRPFKQQTRTFTI